MSIKAKAKKAGVSVVVPCEPGGDPRPCLDALRNLPKAEKGLILEVFVAWGRHPSRQRNLAAQRAQGRWLLFLDSDSRLQPGALPALLDACQSLGAIGAGGPNLPLPDEPALGLAFDQVLASWAGSGSSRARYSPVGRTRLCGEKELILCNLLMDRQVFVGSGGFREDLYPNEENELFNRLQDQGLALAYVPHAQVRRPRRHSLGAFILQAFRYGRGRTQQMRRNAFASDLVNLAPAVLLLVLAVSAAAGHWQLPAAYALGCLLSQGLRPDRALYLALRHQAYALGLFVGILQEPALRDPAVHLERRP